MKKNSNRDETKNLVKYLVDRAGGTIFQNEVLMGIPRGYLKTQVALHLPRFSLEEIMTKGKINEQLIENECRRLGDLLINKIKFLPEELSKMVTDQREETILTHRKGKIFEIKPGGKKLEIIFSPVDPLVGEIIQAKLHYLSSYRPDTLYHYGLFRKGEKFPFSYLAISFLDRKYILDTIPFETNFKEIMVVTRLYNTNNSPRNSSSLLLSLVRGEVKSKNRNIKALVTSVNPNVLFTGSSFKSAAYQFFALMPFQPMYYNGNYLTRKAISKLNLSHDEKKELVGKKLKLQPIIMTINPLDSKFLPVINKNRVKKILVSSYNKG